MRSKVQIVAFVVLLAALGIAQAGTDLNEVGAILVYPFVQASPSQETYFSITNAGAGLVWAHISLIDGVATLPNGNPNPEYCNECDFRIPLTPNDTETLFITPLLGGGIRLFSLDGTVDTSCAGPVPNFFQGMLIVTLEDQIGFVLTDNVLLGESVFVNYGNGSANSIPAIPFQGKGAGGAFVRKYGFDDVTFGKLPRIIAGDFIAPDGGITDTLVLFTLDFVRNFPPRTDCSINGFDAFENPFSNSFLFGCWFAGSLTDIQAEFAYPNLGQFGQLDEHGWFQLSCRVDRDANGTFDANGGVHGAFIQNMALGSTVRRNAPAGPPIVNAASWARALYQSVTAGDATTLRLAGIP